MPLTPSPYSRSTLCHFILSYFLINILLSSLVGFNYLNELPAFHNLTDAPSAALAWFFLLVTFIAQISILFSFVFCVNVIITWLLPYRWLVYITSIAMASAIFGFFISDSITYNVYHMHYAMVAIDIFKAGAFSHVLLLSLNEIMQIAAGVITLLVFETLLAWLVWRRVINKKSSLRSYIVGIIIISCIIISFFLNFIVRISHKEYGFSSHNQSLMIKATRFVPYYDEIYRYLVPNVTDVRHVKSSIGESVIQLTQHNRSLNYPKQILKCEKKEHQLNILVIVIDAWRYDAMNATVTPNIYKFSKESSQFKNHWSGGNCTKAGLFSLFYGLPANYWDTFLHQKRGPELIRQLIKSNYKMGIFASAKLDFPAFSQTVFRDIDPLVRISGDSTSVRDQAVTRTFQDFIQSRNVNQPFFSFLFYDAVHNYCENSSFSHHPFKPSVSACDRVSLTKYADPKPYLNRYKNAVHFVDNEIKKVLDTLKENKLMDDTIVVITADHGEEINDNQSGYWQHASAYTQHQLHVPLLISWPGQKSKINYHFTTHYDLSPTLIKHELHCSNPLSEYTIGQSLLTKGLRPVLISGSYADYAILTKNQIVRIYQGGDFALNDQAGQLIETNDGLQHSSLKLAYQYLNDYLK